MTLKLEVLKRVVSIRKAIQDNAVKSASSAARRAILQEELEQRSSAKLMDMSDDDLKKELADLTDEFSRI